MPTTRYYFPVRNATNGFTLPAPVAVPLGAQWGASDPAFFRCGLVTVRSDGPQQGINNSIVSHGANGRLARLQGVGGPLAAGIISGQFRGVIRASTNNSAADLYVTFTVRVVSNDGATVRGVLVESAHSNVEAPQSTSTMTVGPVAMTPVDAQAGDRLVVELGVYRAPSALVNRSLVWSVGDPVVVGTTNPDEVFVDGSVVAGGVPWFELIVPDPPNPPTDLALVDATPVAASFTFTPPTGGAIPTDYEYRIDGGPAVSTALDTAFTVPGLSPATAYTVEVRTVAATGTSDWTDPLAFATDPAPDPDKRWWTHRLAAALGLDPVNDQPVVEVRTYDHGADTWAVDPDLSNGLTGYTITGGRRTPTARTEPMSATLGFATVRLPATPAIATRLQVALSDAVAAALGLTPEQAVRFTGEVTDPTVDHDARRTSLVCVGRLARAMRRPVDGTSWPVEDDGDRIARILAAVDVQAGVIDPGGPLLATPDRADIAGKLLDQVTASTLGQVVEQPTGDVDWHDAEHRRDTPVHMTLPASSVFRAVTWSQRLDALVNDLDVTTATDTLVTVTDTESADPARYGPWPAAAGTILVDELDAYALGIDIVGRRADPSWQLPDLTVDLLRTIPLADLPDALTLRHASLVELTGLPAGCPVPAEVYVEGWTETATPREWRLQANVSDPLISGTGIRWIDWPDTDDYQWQDLNVDVTWFDLARITDPADTL